jgi:hypothetical protein
MSYISFLKAIAKINKWLKRDEYILRDNCLRYATDEAEGVDYLMERLGSGRNAKKVYVVSREFMYARIDGLRGVANGKKAKEVLKKLIADMKDTTLADEIKRVRSANPAMRDTVAELPAWDSPESGMMEMVSGEAVNELWRDTMVEAGTGKYDLGYHRNAFMGWLKRNAKGHCVIINREDNEGNAVFVANSDILANKIDLQGRLHDAIRALPVTTIEAEQDRDRHRRGLPKIVREAKESQVELSVVQRYDAPPVVNQVVPHTSGDSQLTAVMIQLFQQMAFSQQQNQQFQQQMVTQFQDSNKQITRLLEKGQEEREDLAQKIAEDREELKETRRLIAEVANRLGNLDHVVAEKAEKALEIAVDDAFNDDDSVVATKVAKAVVSLRAHGRLSN